MVTLVEIISVPPSDPPYKSKQILLGIFGYYMYTNKYIYLISEPVRSWIWSADLSADPKYQQYDLIIITFWRLSLCSLLSFGETKIYNE